MRQGLKFLPAIVAPVPALITHALITPCPGILGFSDNVFTNALAANVLNDILRNHLFVLLFHF